MAEEKTKKCECGEEIKIIKFGEKFIAVNVRPDIVYVAGYSFGSRVYEPVSGHRNHNFLCPLKRKHGRRGS